mmetsp:Transcript_50552/g.123280  ORF Transcript_50552/g.123280 Transcript_50552/m.123280 type:complete len:383 (+) Transcript_50552:773-1921(+)
MMMPVDPVSAALTSAALAQPECRNARHPQATKVLVRAAPTPAAAEQEAARDYELVDHAVPCAARYAPFAARLGDRVARPALPPAAAPLPLRPTRRVSAALLHAPKAGLPGWKRATAAPHVLERGLPMARAPVHVPSSDRSVDGVRARRVPPPPTGGLHARDDNRELAVILHVEHQAPHCALPRLPRSIELPYLFGIRHEGLRPEAEVWVRVALQSHLHDGLAAVEPPHRPCIRAELVPAIEHVAIVLLGQRREGNARAADLLVIVPRIKVPDLDANLLRWVVDDAEDKPLVRERGVEAVLDHLRLALHPRPPRLLVVDRHDAVGVCVAKRVHLGEVLARQHRHLDARRLVLIPLLLVLVPLRLLCPQHRHVRQSLGLEDGRL